MTSLAERIAQRGYGKYLLTGMLTGAALKEQARPDSAFKILNVRSLDDGEGNFLPRFEVTMPSGTYIVSVIDEQTIEEEP